MTALSIARPTRRAGVGPVVTVTREYQYAEITADLVQTPRTYGCEGCGRDVVSGGVIYAFPRGGLHTVLWCLPCWEASGRALPARPVQPEMAPCARCGEPDAPARLRDGRVYCVDCYERRAAAS